MIKRRRSGCIGGGPLALLLFLFFLSSPPLQAADDTEKGEEGVQLDPIMIDAKREEDRSTPELERSFNEPFTREKIFSERIEEESIPDVKSALKEMPNVTVREMGAYTKQVEIRGLSGDRIIAVVDGVRIGNQGMTYLGGGEANLIDISTVDSIEVVKGAPSVVYDPGATGGVIKVETKEIAEEAHLKLKYTLGYDSGLEKVRNAAALSASKYRLGAALSYSRNDADAYKVKNQEKLEEAIRETNERDGRTGTPFEIRDLGFEDESLTLNLSYRFNPNHKLSFQRTDYEAKDISFTVGASTVVHVDLLTRETSQLRYQIKKLGLLQDLSFAYADQELSREAFPFQYILESRNLNAAGIIPIKNTKLTIGGEYVADEADTRVLSEQEYMAGYLSAEHLHDRFTWLAGVRANRWETQAKLPSGRDPSIVADLVSVNGPFDPETGEFERSEETAFTYATGVVYVWNDSNNLSLNYSKTHRFPSLFERFAVGGFTGGGLDLAAETADNVEAAWKFYDGLFFGSVSIFYSDFDDYITVKERRRLTDPIALQACIRAGACDPLNGDFDGREAEFFSTDFPFFNVKRAVNRGFEVSLKRLREEDYEAGFNFGLNDFDVRDVHDPADKNLVVTNAHPLEFSFYYKKYFSDWAAKPWVQIKGRYVTDTPRVKQEEGFDPFFVADLFAGLKYRLLGYSDVTFNAGIRNIADKVYHEPFSALDGLERSFFFNLSVEI